MWFLDVVTLCCPWLLSIDAVPWCYPLVLPLDVVPRCCSWCCPLTLFLVLSLVVPRCFLLVLALDIVTQWWPLVLSLGAVPRVCPLIVSLICSWFYPLVLSLDVTPDFAWCQSLVLIFGVVSWCRSSPALFNSLIFAPLALSLIVFSLLSDVQPNAYRCLDKKRRDWRIKTQRLYDLGCHKPVAFQTKFLAVPAITWWCPWYFPSSFDTFPSSLVRFPSPFFVFRLPLIGFPVFLKF